MSLEVLVRDDLLSAGQWGQLEALADGLSAEQARWISGYFAGLDAGLLRGAAGASGRASAAQARSLTILYGTETGNSRALAKALAAAAGEHGLGANLVDMADYKVRQLKDEQDLLFIVSTYGEGDPPQPSVGFFEFIEGARAPRLEGVRFSVLALGDSTYEKYCEAGKRIDRRLEELGAIRIGPRVDCDVDYEDQATAWSRSLIDMLSAEAPSDAKVVAFPRHPSPRAPVAHDKSNPFAATVLENMPIVARESSKETRHVELDLSGSGLAYAPGDALGLVPTNDPRVVGELLAATGLSGGAEVIVRNARMPLEAALARRFEITAATPRFVEQWARLSDADALKALAGESSAADRMRFLEAHQVIDIVRRFPVPGVDAQALLAGLRPLQPRLYSIASSRAAVGDEAHLTVAPVRFELHGTCRGGVASSQIADRVKPGDTVPVYVQENPHFRLPADDVPIVMVGPGTGVAPFRAFLQEREVRAAGGRSWLFFGERNRRSDFLYQLEWQQWLKDGVLTRLDVAFSRDSGEKVYVQHRMLERAAELYAWLEEGAHFYVCGDEKAMARDVHDALVELIAEQRCVSREAALDYVARLASEHRYQRDVY